MSPLWKKLLPFIDKITSSPDRRECASYELVSLIINHLVQKISTFLFLPSDRKQRERVSRRANYPAALPSSFLKTNCLKLYFVVVSDGVIKKTVHSRSEKLIGQFNKTNLAMHLSMLLYSVPFKSFSFLLKLEDFLLSFILIVSKWARLTMNTINMQ